MKTAILRHYSNVPGSEGIPGQTVTGPDELIDSWVAARGAVCIGSVEGETQDPMNVSSDTHTPAPIRRKRRNRALEAYEQSVRGDGDSSNG